MRKGQLLQLLKTCYGLLDGPMAWFRHLKKVLVEELGYTQSIADPCLYFLHREPGVGWKKLAGVVAVATDDLLHGGDEEHKRLMAKLNEKYKLGKFSYGSGRFVGKQFTPQKDGSILIDQEHYLTEKVIPIPLTRTRKAQRYSPCTEAEITALRSSVGALSWVAKETRPDLQGRVALLQQAFPKPRVRDLMMANQLAAESLKHPASIRISPIDPEKLRVSAVTDASWGNAKEPRDSEDQGTDYWVENPTSWIRHHVTPRRTLFHPGMSESGPDLHQLKPGRHTRMNRDGSVEEHDDQWPKVSAVTIDLKGPWRGQTIFEKNDQHLPASDISEQFLQNVRTNSQGGHIIFFHDVDLQYEPSAEVSIVSWKSFKLKRKVVNTLSAECQALVSGIGHVHWYRFLLLEAQGHDLRDQDWEQKLQQLPFLAVTDSKSLFDTLSKQTCPFSQIDDKRTSIDISILKQEMNGAGVVRWIDGRNMIADSLTKATGGSYLRFVMKNGRWTLNEQGFTTLNQDRPSNECFFLFEGLWSQWFRQTRVGAM